jgi:hypothetical protein
VAPHQFEIRDSDGRLLGTFLYDPQRWHEPTVASGTDLTLLTRIAMQSVNH